MEIAVVYLGVEPLELVLDRVQLRADGVGSRALPVPGSPCRQACARTRSTGGDSCGSASTRSSAAAQRLERGRHRVRELALVQHEPGHRARVRRRGGGAHERLEAADRAQQRQRVAVPARRLGSFLRPRSAREGVPRAASAAPCRPPRAARPRRGTRARRPSASCGRSAPRTARSAPSRGCRSSTARCAGRRRGPGGRACSWKVFTDSHISAEIVSRSVRAPSRARVAEDTIETGFSGAVVSSRDDLVAPRRAVAGLRRRP